MTASPDAGLFDWAEACLRAADPREKVRLTEQVAADWSAGRLGLGGEFVGAPINEPGRQERPELVRPRDLARRTPAHDRGRAALIHAVAHIEYNAINLAWDAVYRFRTFPAKYYDDRARDHPARRGRARSRGEPLVPFPLQGAGPGPGGDLFRILAGIPGRRDPLPLEPEGPAQGWLRGP